MNAIHDCSTVRDLIIDYVSQALPPGERAACDAHLRVCAGCRASVARFREVDGALKNVFEPVQGISPGTSKLSLEAITARARTDFAVREEVAEAAEAGLAERLGGAPWWGVSLALHVLVIALASLVTMAIALPPAEEAMVMVTELQPRQDIKVEEEKPKTENRNALEATHETPPTDPTSQEASNVVVPPDILAKAELGDHFETINLDRPDTQSEFGNPDAHMFHSVKGDDDAAGGGGVGGAGLDELIGVGGASSPGSGGGWGGGHGTGIGVDRGAGRGSFGSRNGGGRKLMVKRHGGSAATENAVDAALRWLAYHQENDGHWDIKKHGAGVEAGASGHDHSVTALAVLTFLGAGHTAKVGFYKDNVRRGIEWLIQQQDAAGYFPPSSRDSDDREYDLAIGTMALSEAFGMTRDPKVGVAAQKGVDLIAKIQKPNGGWMNGEHYKTSMSVFGWMILALKSAKIAQLKIPPQVFENAVGHLQACTKKESDGYWGIVSYNPDHAEPPTLTLTAVGMTCFQFTGFGNDTGHQAEMLAKDPPAWKPGIGYRASDEYNLHPQSFYHWYYGTLGMFQAGGEQWKTWNKALKETLLPNQRKGGDEDGSWDPVTTMDLCGGRVYTTAMGALALEVYYRYALLKQ